MTAENFVLPRRLDWRNLNTLWGSLLAETLSRLGCRLAVVSPGSRSAPLTYALAQHPDIEAIPVLDERSAAFFQRCLPQPVSINLLRGKAPAWLRNSHEVGKSCKPSSWATPIHDWV